MARFKDENLELIVQLVQILLKRKLLAPKVKDSENILRILGINADLGVDCKAEIVKLNSVSGSIIGIEPRVISYKNDRFIHRSNKIQDPYLKIISEGIVCYFAFGLTVIKRSSLGKVSSKSPEK